MPSASTMKLNEIWRSLEKEGHSGKKTGGIYLAPNMSSVSSKSSFNSLFWEFPSESEPYFCLFSFTELSV